MQSVEPLSRSTSFIDNVFEYNGDLAILMDTDAFRYLLSNKKREKCAYLQYQDLLHLPLYRFEDSPRIQQVP